MGALSVLICGYAINRVFEMVLASFDAVGRLLFFMQLFINPLTVARMFSWVFVLLWS